MRPQEELILKCFVGERPQKLVCAVASYGAEHTSDSDGDGHWHASSFCLPIAADEAYSQPSH
jgi:hypothetical protein